MNWSSEGYILSARKHGETAAIIDVLTPDYGRHLGLVRGGISRKYRPVLQPGNKVKIDWNARLSEHLGVFLVEPLEYNAAEIMEDRLSLAALNSLCGIARESLPEREVHLNVYQAFEVVLKNITFHEIWPALYIKWELGLLFAMGYGLDLNSCAASGSKPKIKGFKKENIYLYSIFSLINLIVSFIPKKLIKNPILGPSVSPNKTS